MWRETEIVEANEKIPHKDHAKTDEEEADNGPKKQQLKPKPRKWKLQARVQKVDKRGSSEPKNSKRPSREILRPSPDYKKKRLLSPLKQFNGQNQFSPFLINRQLKLVDEEQVEGEDEAAMGEDILAGVGSLPRQQP